MKNTLKKIDTFIKSHMRFITIATIVSIIICFIFHSNLYLSEEHLLGFNLFECVEIIYIVEFFIIAFYFASILKKYILLMFPVFFVCKWISTFCAKMVTDHYLKTSICTIAIVNEKNIRHGNVKSGTSSMHYLFLNISKLENTISEEIYNEINEGDTVLVKASRQYPHIYKVTKWHPTSEEIDKYKVPRMYKYNEEQPMPPVEQYPAAVRDSALRQSHKQLGFVFEKIDDEYYRHFLRVGIADSLTTLHEFYETDRLYAKAYKRIGVGDTVIVRIADAMPQINQVVNWRPTQSEIQKCRIPAPYTASGAANHTQAFVDSVMQQSHEQLGFVFDKYEDEHVGAYLEVGVSDSLTRTYRFYKYKDLYTKVFKTTSIGDTVTLRVPDNYPQINQVVKWKYVKEEEPTDKESSSDKLEGVTDKEIEDEKLDADFAFVYTKGINSVWPKYFVKLKYNNTVSDYIGIDDIYKKQIYESLKEGDTVIIQKPKSNSEKIQVLSWRPTPEEIEQCRATAQGTENN